MLLLSSASQESKWVKREVERAVDLEKIVIPLQLEKIVLNDTFGVLISIDQIVELQRIDEKSEQFQALLKNVSFYTGTRKLFEKQNENKKTNKDIEFKTTYDLYNEGLKDKDIAEQCVRNDKELYDVEEGSPQEGSVEKWEKFIGEHPEAWGFITPKDSTYIVGNFSTVILSDNQQKLLDKGELYDGLVELDDTLPFSPGKDYCLYILNISLNKEYNTPQNRAFLFDKFFEFIMNLADEFEVTFNKIYFTSWRNRGQLKYYGFETIMEKTDGSVVLGIENFPNDLKRWDRKDELLRAYNK